MINCEQSSGQNILQHGLAVKDNLCILFDYLQNRSTPNSRLPNWLINYKSKILASLLDQDTLSNYAIWHDCGKPFCRTTDGYGKQHFPGHTEKSAEIWASISSDKTIEKLIKGDMEIHKLKASQLNEFLAKYENEAISLLLTSLAELYANASMFGEIGFKIKFKKNEKIGKLICQKIFEE